MPVSIPRDVTNTGKYLTLTEGQKAMLRKWKRDSDNFAKSLESQFSNSHTDQNNITDNTTKNETNVMGENSADVGSTQSSCILF